MDTFQPIKLTAVEVPFRKLLYTIRCRSRSRRAFVHSLGQSNWSISRKRNVDKDDTRFNILTNSSLVDDRVLLDDFPFQSNLQIIY
jgi:hypothetical protein